MTEQPGDSGQRRRHTALWMAAAIAVGATMVVVVREAAKRSVESSRCPPGSVSMDARCCLDGQTLQDHACKGKPVSCPSGMDPVEDSCVVRPARARIEPGRLRIGPGDWEAQGVVVPREVVIRREFWIDVHEATVWQWRRCVGAGVCALLAGADESGLPARGMTFEQARAFCSSAGGSLPREDEWIMAASGAVGHRYPWGDTGAVCSRAVWGLAEGPCARGGVGPDLVGLHQSDITPEGVVGLAGSVSEWVIGEGGAAAVRGGSWRSRFAAELRTWHSASKDPNAMPDDVGVRCVYSSASASEPTMNRSRSP